MQHTNGIIYGVTGGVVYSFDVGMKPFVALLFNAGQVGTSVGILGQGFEGTKKVKFNGVSASFTAISDSYMTAIVPRGDDGRVRNCDHVSRRVEEQQEICVAALSVLGRVNSKASH